MNNTVPVITIDGPSGTGKGTIGLLLADWLDWNFLDSGALYRLVALAALRRGISLEDEQALGRLARELPVEFRRRGRELEILLDGTLVGEAIRDEQVAAAASKVAALGAVRAGLLALQRGFRRPPGLVADGRDMGTVVFPDAPLKLYLTASAEERARRRYKQLKEKGNDVSLAQLAEDIARRDTRDSERELSPLRPAEDAIVIDTSDLGIEEVFARVRTLVREKLGGDQE